MRVSDARTIRVFISSPIDVRPERLKAEQIVARLDREFSYRFHVEAVLWEREPLVATHHFQDPENIPQPHGTDIVVVILWSRLGVPLPEEKFRGAISGRPVTGTEWEFEDAYAGYQENGIPDLLVYRKTARISADLDDEAALDEARAQRAAVQDFIGRWFRADSGPGYTAASHSFAATAEFEQLLYEHLRTLLERRAGPRAEGAAIRWHEAPYRGLPAYEYEHAPIFFGRTWARNELRELLARRIDDGTAFVLVFGASGSGKSSLVKAGLLPDLAIPGMIGRVGLVRRAVMRPSDGGGDPLAALAAAILAPAALPELAGLQYSAEQLADLLRSAPSQAALPIRQGLAEAGKAADPPLTEIGEARLVIVVDQLEEMFTIDRLGDADRTAFVGALDTLAKSGLVWIVATMRSDFFDRLETMPALAALSADGRFLLLPPGDAEIGQIVRQPALEAGLRFEHDSARGVNLDELIRQAAAKYPGALPLLSFLLDQLWQRRSAQRELTFAAYDEVGGFEGAIGSRAEEVFRAQPDAVQDQLPSLLRELVTIEDGKPVSRVVPLSRFPEGSARRALVDSFLDPEARLLVSDDGQLRLTHEALITHWELAQEQIARDRVDLATRRTIEQAEVEWRAAEPRVQDTYLLRDPRLANALDLDRRWRDELGVEIRAFIARSAERARAATRRRRLILTAVIALLAVFAAVSSAGLYIAETQRNVALIAQSQFLARDARTVTAQGDAMLGMLLALAALPADLSAPDRPYVAEAETALENAFVNRREKFFLAGHKDGLLSASFSPDGSRVVTASADGTAMVWDAATGRRLSTCGRENMWVLSARFSPDNRMVLTTGADGMARLYQVEGDNCTQIVVLQHHLELSASGDAPKEKFDPVTSGSFSPDGTRILTVSPLGAILWDAATKNMVKRLEGVSEFAIFSPDGRQIAVEGGGDAIDLFDGTTGDKLQFCGGGDDLTSVAISTRGLLVAGSKWGPTYVWDITSCHLVAKLAGQDAISAVAFSPDGKLIATVSGPIARVWDVSNFHDGDTETVPRATQKGHQGEITMVVFSPDSEQLLTAGTDGTTRLWRTYDDDRPVILRDDDQVTSATFSSDGTTILTASRDKSARLWSVDPLSLAAIPGAGSPYRLAMSSDGTRVALSFLDPYGKEGGNRTELWRLPEATLILKLDGVSSAIDFSSNDKLAAIVLHGAAALWNTDTGTLIHEFPRELADVEIAAFLSNDKQLLTADSEGSVKIWDLNSFTVVGRWHLPEGQKFSHYMYAARIQSYDEQSVYIYDAPSGKEIAVVKQRPKDQADDGLWVSPDGSRAVSVISNVERLWDTATGKELAVLGGFRVPLMVLFSPDGNRVIPVVGTSPLKVWDARAGKILLDLPMASDLFAFSHNGKWLVTEAGVWGLPRCQELIDEARAALSRQLSDAEREKYFLIPSKPSFAQRIYESVRPLVAGLLPQAGDRCN